MKTLMTKKKQMIDSEQKNKLEFFLSQEIQHIANEFEEFKKLTFDSQVSSWSFASNIQYVVANNSKFWCDCVSYANYKFFILGHAIERQ